MQLGLGERALHAEHEAVVELGVVVATVLVEAVDPANRLIASTLEQRWNDAMQRVIELEAELASFERQTLRTITADQKQQISSWSDFPKL